MRILSLILHGCLGIALMLRFGLYLIEEPTKIQMWTLLQMVLPIIGLSVVLFQIAIFLQTKPKKWSLRNRIAIIGLAVFAIILPYGGGEIGITYPSRMQTAAEILHIRVPVDGKVMVAWGGDGSRRNYHAAYPDQRWAYDLVVEPHSLSSQKLTSYGCYGKNVLAPISGEIITAHEGEADITPGKTYYGKNVFGNYIVIKPREKEETRLIIAHLKKDSIQVSEGQLVREGDPIAQCGNSGSSTEPHIHIHFLKIVTENSEKFLIGQPLFFRDLIGPENPVGGFKRVGNEKVANGDVIEHNPNPE